MVREVEEQLSRQLRSLQVEVKEEMNVTFQEQKAHLDKTLHRLDHRIAELLGNCAGLSKEMQDQARWNKKMEDQLGEAKRQSSEGLRSKYMELERRLSKASSQASNAALRPTEEAVMKHGRRLEDLETRFEARFKHLAENLQSARSSEARLMSLGAGQPDTGSCGVDFELFESRLQELEKLKAQKFGMGTREDLDTLAKVVHDRAVETARMQNTLLVDQVKKRMDAFDGDLQGLKGGHHHLNETMQSVGRNMSALDKKVSSQNEESVSNYSLLKLKADGETNRVNTLIERLETAHEPTIKSLRAEMVQARSHDRTDSVLSRLQEHMDGHESVVTEIRENIRRTNEQMAALAPRPEASNAPLSSIQDAMAKHSQRLQDLETRFDARFKDCAGDLQSTRSLEANSQTFVNDWAKTLVDTLENRLKTLEDTVVDFETRTTSVAESTCARVRDLEEIHVFKANGTPLRNLIHEIAAAMDRCKALQADTQALRSEIEQAGGTRTDAILADLRRSIDGLQAKAVNVEDKAKNLDAQIACLEKPCFAKERSLKMASASEMASATEMESTKERIRSAFNEAVAPKNQTSASERSPTSLSEAVASQTSSSALHLVDYELSPVDIDGLDKQLKQVEEEAKNFIRKLKDLQPEHESRPASKREIDKTDYLKLVNVTGPAVETEAQVLKQRLERLENARGTGDTAEGAHRAASSAQRDRPQHSNRLDTQLEPLKQGSRSAAEHATNLSHLTEIVKSLEMKVESDVQKRCDQLADELASLRSRVAQICHEGEREVVATDSEHFYIGT